jgi:hypothetical protein
VRAASALSSHPGSVDIFSFIHSIRCDPATDGLIASVFQRGFFHFVDPSPCVARLRPPPTIV